MEALGGRVGVGPGALEPPEHSCVLPRGWRQYFNEQVSVGSGVYIWIRAYLECCVLALVKGAGEREL